MSSGGVAGYAALNARVRVMYSTLLSPADYAALNDAADFDSLITLLKTTPYGPYLEKAKDLTPRRAAFQIRARLADAYGSVIHMSPEHARGLMEQRFRNFEVDNLKAVLRGIVTGATWERVRFVLFPLGSATTIKAQEMVESGNVAAAVELTRGTPYFESLSNAMLRFSAEQNIFPLEVALDLDYWRRLWAEVRRLPIEDQTQAAKVIGSLLDVNNLMWAIRYRVYHHLSEEELINYTLPIGYHVRDEHIRMIAAGAEIATVVTRIFPDITDVDAMVQEIRSGLPRLEVQLKRHVLRQCQAAFLGNPFHIGIPLAYLMLQEFEIEDLTVLIEAKSNQLPAEEYQPFLLAQNPVRI